jgi:hypothetical protein
VHALEVDHGFLAQHQQEQAALLVFDEEVLGMAAGDFAAQVPRVVDCEQRRMVDGLGVDAERRQIGKQIFRWDGRRSFRILSLAGPLPSQ